MSCAQFWNIGKAKVLAVELNGFDENSELIPLLLILLAAQQSNLEPCIFQ